MKYIKTVEIKYFRSIYNLKLKELSEGITVFTGCNDTGKSNILRALNLFFNSEVDLKEPLLFERDFSKIRRQEIKTSQKARQLISISAEIISPKNYITLPKTFWVTRTFDRNNKLVEFSFDKNISVDSKKTAVAKRLFNSLEYIYIPAVKDRDTFSQVLAMLKSNLPSIDAVDFERFNAKLKKYGEGLKEDLKKNINLSPTLSLPMTSQELFASLDFTIQDQFVSTSLSQRGDGIRCRFIPAIMNYIALNRHRKRFIWGIEEPENSLEFIRALELNDTLEHAYSKHAQIFVTSHSPAFVNSIKQDQNKTIYLLRKTGFGKIESVLVNKKFLQNNENLLSKELGYITLQQDLAECLTSAISKIQQREGQYKVLESQLRAKKNIVYVEGPTDVLYFEKAQKLFGFSGFSIMCIGQEKDGQYISSGEQALSKASDVFKYHSELLENKKIVLLYDFDSNKKDVNFGNLFVRSTTKNDKELQFKKGIENLLMLPPDFNRGQFISKKEHEDGYGMKTIKESLNKMKMAEYILSLDESSQRQILSCVKEELIKISQIFNEKEI